MERMIEILLLRLRWLLVPLYLALLGSVLTIYVMAGRELWYAISGIMEIEDSKLVSILCSVLDLVLVANLLVMVAVSSYESYVARIAFLPAKGPEWLGKMDSGSVKVKVAVAVSMIAAIHMLKDYLQDITAGRLLLDALANAVFLLAALATVMVDRFSRHVTPAGTPLE